MVRARFLAAGLVSIVLLAASAAGGGDAPEVRRSGGSVPAPDFDRVDHAKPNECLALPETIGRRETLENLARELKASTPRRSLAAISAWINAHLHNDDKAAYAWRDVDRMIADRTFGGCADHAVLYGGLARACGIPTIWVKTMDADWIRDFRHDPEHVTSWRGHVFLEVHIDGKWRLLDASQGVIYEEYDPKQRILPGTRWAYDKGADPYELLLSPRWEEWKTQTAAHFMKFDLTLLPVAGGDTLGPRVYIAANNPAFNLVSERVRGLKKQVGRSGNCDFDLWVPAARNGWLIVASIGDTVVLPDKYRSLLPLTPEKIKEALASAPSGVWRKANDDGTIVILVCARDEKAFKSVIDTLKLDGT